jgi:hypothetical protein
MSRKDASMSFGVLLVVVILIVFAAASSVRVAENPSFDSPGGGFLYVVGKRALCRRSVELARAKVDSPSWTGNGDGPLIRTSVKDSIAIRVGR